MCPLATGLGSKFDEAHFNHFKDAIDYITVKKGACEFAQTTSSGIVQKIDTS